MANTKSAEKAARQAEKHRAHNVTLRSRMRTAIRKVTDAVAKGSKDEAQSSYRAAVPLIVSYCLNDAALALSGRPAQKPPGRARQDPLGRGPLDGAAGFIVLERQQQRQARVAAGHFTPMPTFRPRLERTGQRPEHVQR